MIVFLLSYYPNLKTNIIFLFFWKHNLISFKLNSSCYNKKRECPSSSIQNIKGNYKTEADRQDSTSSKDDSKFKTKLKCVDEPFTTKLNSWEIVIKRSDISTQSALRNTAETKSVAFLGFKHTGTQDSKTVIDIDQHFHLMFGREKILKIEIVDKAVRFSKDGKDS